MALRTTSQIVFACHSRACRPPTSGGTGGSSSSKGSGTSRKGWTETGFGTDRSKMVVGDYTAQVRPSRVKGGYALEIYGKKGRPTVTLHTTKRSAQEHAEETIRGLVSRVVARGDEPPRGSRNPNPNPNPKSEGMPKSEPKRPALAIPRQSYPASKKYRIGSHQI